MTVAVLRVEGKAIVLQTLLWPDEVREPDFAVLAEKKVLVTGTMAEMLIVDHPWVHEYFHGPRARAAMAATD